ncbi:MAG: class I SAM-dependent methyltransferase [Dehalococcoidales bacterium]|jgi:SAM-dependent methyltransferase|nr:class I SAM-dependent methyltransferase [Dehalococcoidales bacterium]|tara:strand:- start:222 stop:878 length:657 start_codon:yes stop_codon:yes gene_type:complete
MGFTEITGPEYTEDLMRRLRGEVPELTWLKQFREILRPNLRPGLTLLDVGCATGYAYNSFREDEVAYTGLDVEADYLERAAQWFSDVPNIRFIEHDINISAAPVSAEIVTCSAILEHCPGLMPALRHLVDSTGRILLLRTFLGETEHIYSIPSPVLEYRDTHRKHYNQYSFDDMLSYIEGRGFKTRVFRDEYTDSMPQFMDGVTRAFYVVHAEKGWKE